MAGRAGSSRRRAARRSGAAVTAVGAAGPPPVGGLAARPGRRAGVSGSLPGAKGVGHNLSPWCPVGMCPVRLRPGGRGVGLFYSVPVISGPDGAEDRPLAFPVGWASQARRADAHAATDVCCHSAETWASALRACDARPATTTTATATWARPGNEARPPLPIVYRSGGPGSRLSSNRGYRPKGAGFQ